jgi:cell wall-associated NlpC family hydrolase
VAQAQYDATTKVAPSTALAPGDLVFFGHRSDGIDHVGLFAGLVGGRPVMVDAPHAGADVRAEYFSAAPGAAFGSMVYVGATRP